MVRNKRVILLVAAVVLVVCAWLAWNKLASTTRIGLVNFQTFQASSFIKSNADPFIEFEDVPLDRLDKLSGYDFVLGFGMGMRITAEQRAQIQQAADGGTPVFIYAATNPENNICSLDSVQKAGVSGYMRNGNKRNYQSMARYIRQHIDGKRFFVHPAEPVAESASDVLYYLDEELSFPTVAEFEGYVREHGFYREGKPKVAIVGGLNDPFSGNRENIDSLIVSLQGAGLNVYPVYSYRKLLPFLKEIRPDAVIHFAHGRMVMGQADAAVDWLKEQNVPVFTPLSILQTEEEWVNDPMGMFGGFMSQSIVVPELDGAIYPYVLNAQEVDEDGVFVVKAIPDRLRNFTQIVSNFVRLKQMRNADKKVAIYYFKGVGQSSLTAQGLETVPSLYNLLKRLKAEGYRVDGLPATEKEFGQMLMQQGAVLSTYAEGAFDDFMKNGHPVLVEKQEYESWVHQALPEALYADVVKIYGEAPGGYMSTVKDGKPCLAVARIQLGNIALLPQPMAAVGDDAFAIVHGAKTAPPHTYIGAYLWAQYGFGADAMVHFGTHGSLEFTPQKQVALSKFDWPDRLVGTVPHFYYYTIGNVGESMMAKRRSYATTISYLTPPFMESKTRTQFKELEDRIQAYYKAADDKKADASLAVKRVALKMGLHRDLRLDSVPANPYSEEEVARIENFAEEIANEKMTGQLYTAGVPYSPEKIRSSVLAMSADPIAYSVAALDRESGKVTDEQLKSKVFFTRRYLNPAKELVNRVLDGKPVTDGLICEVAGITPEKLAEAAAVTAPPKRSMMGMGKAAPVKYTAAQKREAAAITEVQRTINHITVYRKALEESPELEMKSVLNALAGGYVAPTSGGDAVANPMAVPTGRNLYSINAEATPSALAWEKGMELANNTLEQYKKTHGDYPRKVSYTFWSSEFVESEGATIAQVLYMLGVEPVRDPYGRVSDLRLIPSETLGRPRVDVVVQTSGQFRDLAASRLALISRAVEMAAASSGDRFGNRVAESTVETERLLVEQGVSPKDARDLSTQRVFGGVNGMYGTGIQDMITSGDRWEDEREIADTYINNMGAVYGSDKNWGDVNAGLLRAVLHNTDAVVQPRQSNTWGALSLDHVYEFMGGMNLAVRHVTGKDPDAYFADYRNRNRVKMQELKEAIGVESRSTIFNPEYIKEVMKGGASSASQITEVVTNTYGWNVTKPDVVDNEMWNKIYDVYVKDAYQLGTEQFFKAQNPAALQEITAVMMETARKGMWKASDEQLGELARLHTDLVKEFGSTGSGFSGGNAKLQDFIARKASPENAAAYRQRVKEMKTAGTVADRKGMVLKKDEVAQTERGERNSLNGVWIAGGVFVLFIVLLFILKRKRKGN
ncbi:MAG: cobaltochelatase subunit CobN [Odoribacter splanchnicus]|nr:cobaltochelatase subunit CobN [Odoribacter splanchnicus]